jgi:hypothetical protein
VDAAITALRLGWLRRNAMPVDKPTTPELIIRTSYCLDKRQRKSEEGADVSIYSSEKGVRRKISYLSTTSIIVGNSFWNFVTDIISCS